VLPWKKAREPSTLQNCTLGGYPLQQESLEEDSDFKLEDELSWWEGHWLET